jgi:hypothetical protein
MSQRNTDQWIEANSPLPPEKLHAIGVITVRWNRCELQLILLMAAVARMPRRDIWAFVHDVGDVAICSKLETFSLFRGHHPLTRELITNALTVYDLCRQNRNCVVHAWTLSTGPDPTLFRPSKKPRELEPSPFTSSIDSLRKIADEIQTLWFRLWDLVISLETDEPPTSLEKLPLPALLSKRLQTPKEPKLRRRPSSR